MSPTPTLSHPDPPDAEGFRAARRSAVIATFAALTATLGDLAMLYEVNARRPEFHLPPSPYIALWLGGVLGVVAIPFYAFGYRAAACLIEAGSARDARIVRTFGAAGSLTGAIIHALTTLIIWRGRQAGTLPGDPLAAVAASPLLVGLWGVGTVLMVIASAAFVRTVLAGGTRSPRVLAWMSPPLLSVILALAGLPSTSLRAFLTPAAPNIAHALFFAACARAAAAARESRVAKVAYPRR